ncbi:hypothetical protein ACHAWU_002569 [Discostella pseudostelligera]|uniref:Uncharacterized protein n=1 Tax=Discostella pseudostelligera TaxID=259834 RepID=A0ABD3M3P6_9STRA
MVRWVTIIWTVSSPCFAFLSSRHYHRWHAMPSITCRPSDADVHARVGRQHVPIVASSSTDNDGGNASSSEATSAQAQDIRLFLTQRTIQSFMFLLASTRDLHTVAWLDRFVQPITINNYWNEDVAHKPGAGDTFRENDKRLGSKLLNYHGLSALNTTMFPAWDTFFTSLLEQPDTVLKIHTPKDLGERAYSNFDIDIEPARLCARILSVREQLAREMTGDLKAIANMGQLIFNSYWENAKNRKDTKQTKTGNGNGNGRGGDSSPYGFDRPSTMYINFDPQDDAEFAPSPLRKGNFDLLYNLITQFAVMKLLQDEGGVVVGEDEVQNKCCQVYLSKFYNDRLLTHFVGLQWYGKGDDFIEELILGSPIMMPRSDAEKKDEKRNDSEISSAPLLVVEPMRIAEQILLRRDKIALEWMDIMQQTPSDHTSIRKMQLDRLTGVAGASPVSVVLLDDDFQ